MVDEGGQIRIFVSYSHKDKKLREELDAHLALLRNSGAVKSWYDGVILPGDEWDPAIMDEINRAHVILLLISANFLSSKFCYGREMKRAIERHDAGEARVVPIMLRPCDWEDADFAKLKGLPEDMRPVTTWSIQDEAWTDIAKGIRTVVTFEQTKLTKISDGTETAVETLSEGTTMLLRQCGTQTISGRRAFWVEAVAETPPDGGYTGFQTLIHYGSLIYEAADVQYEFFWPSSLLSVALRTPNLPALGENLVLHGVLSGLLPPLPLSDYAGTLLRIRLQCPEPEVKEEHSHEVLLLSYTGANTNGSCYFNEKGRIFPGEPTSEVDLPGLGATDIAARIDLVCNAVD